MERLPRDMQGLQRKVKRTFTPRGFEIVDIRSLAPELWGNVDSFFAGSGGVVAPEDYADHHAYSNWWEAGHGAYWPCPQRKSEWMEQLRPLLEEWSSTPLEAMELYGLRVYHSGAVLNKHVDRSDTHAISVIVNVHQEGISTPWPLQIVDHEGQEHEVILEPGQGVFYESATCMHGRVRPLEGVMP